MLALLSSTIKGKSEDAAGSLSMLLEISVHIVSICYDGYTADGMYKSFAEMMGWKEWNGENLSEEHAITFLASKLCSVLGIE